MTTSIEQPGAREGSAAGDGAGADPQPRAARVTTAGPRGRSSVTTAILLATTGTDFPAAGQDWHGVSIVRRLVDQLAALGVHTAHVVTRSGWADAIDRSLAGAGAGVRVHVSESPAGDLLAIAAAARGADEGVVLLSGDLVLGDEAVGGLLSNPRVPTGVLTAMWRRPFQPGIRAQKGRLVSAGSPYHTVQNPSAYFHGILKIAEPDRPAFVDAAERLASIAGGKLPLEWEENLARSVARWHADLDEEAHPEPEAEVERRVHIVRQDVVSPLLVALVRSGVQLGTVQLRRLFWARPLTPDNLESALERYEAYDEDRILLDASVKPTDGFFTTFFVSSYSKYLARWAARAGLSPNTVTTLSLVIGVAAAAAFATGDRAGYVAGGVLAYLAFVTDCVDGQLARYTRTFSKLGAWLDSVFDRAKEYILYAGLAIGSANAGDDVWVLAAAALTLQTARHAMDFSFTSIRYEAIEAVEHPPLEQAPDTAARAAWKRRGNGAAAEPAPPPAASAEALSLPQRFLRFWRRLDDTRAILWAKKIVAFPIGERFAAISIVTAVFEPRVTFVVLLACGGFAATYSTAGRVLRSIAR